MLRPITEKICDWRTHLVPDSGKRNTSFAQRDAASSTNNPLPESAKSKSCSTAESACVYIVDITETCVREIPLSMSLKVVAR